MKYKKLHLAGCIILNESSEVLLLHRNTPIRKQWEMPGGKLEDGEDHQTAAEREIEEEIGVVIEIVKKLGRKDFIEDEYVVTYTWYLAKVKKGKPTIMEREKFDDLKFISWSDLSKMNDQLSPNTHNLVEAYFSGKINLN